MTEQEFLKQIWRPHDKITTTDGVPGKVLGVSFNRMSVRAFISGAPEWVSFALIETHITGKGEDADEEALIDSLREKVIRADRRINALELEKEKLVEKISKNYLGDILKAVNLMRQGLQEKKHKMDQVDSGLRQIQAALEKIGGDYDEERVD